MDHSAPLVVLIYIVVLVTLVIPIPVLSSHLGHPGHPSQTCRHSCPGRLSRPGPLLGSLL